MTPQRARKDLGRAGEAMLRRLQKRLNERGRAATGIRYRYAQSIVTRSEAELLGLSMPRFALRAYLDDDRQNFVNARRLGTFCDQARHWDSRRPAGPTWQQQPDIVEDRRAKRQRPALAIRKAVCIADSVLSPPPSVRDAFHILSTELGKSYGEGRPIVGTPFVNHIPLAGGGLCAQAVCFMATALLHKWAWGVHGIAEITALAADGDQNELPLTGLRQEQMHRYFEAVGLSANWQHAPERPTAEAEGNFFRRALRAYLLSNMPVIVPVDLGRMRGIAPPPTPLRRAAILGDDDIQREMLDPEELYRRNHLVIAVGCARGSGSRDFLINDPFSFPFLPASSDQLWDAAHYQGEGMTSLFTGMFLPVTPKVVQLPLEEYCGPDGAARFGLLSAARELQIRYPDRKPRPYPSCGNGKRYDPGEFQLIQLKDLPHAEVVPADVREVLDHLQLLPDQKAKSKHWYWVQYVARGEWGTDSPASIWLWDAEQPPNAGDFVESPDRYESLLVRVLRQEQHAWEGAFPPDQPVELPERIEFQTAEPESPRRRGAAAPRPITGALITSFTTAGLAVSMANWPRKVRHAEAYMLMQPDVEGFFGRGRLSSKWWRQLVRWTLPRKVANGLRALPLHYQTYHSGGRWRRRPRRCGWLARTLGVPWPVIPAVDQMAAKLGDRVAVRSLAGRLDALFRSQEIGIVSFATFLPELASPDPNVARLGQDALCFLVDVAHELQSPHHPVKVIEVVGGSSVEGIWPGKRRLDAQEMGNEAESDWAPQANARRELVYVANRSGDAQAIERLYDGLVPAARRELEARRALPPERHVAIAVELEPGPIYGIRDWTTLKRFCTLVAGNGHHSGAGGQLAIDADKLAEVIGVNLDCGHWRLARINPDQVRSDEIVRRRVVHAHLSSQGHGHFADVAPGTLGPHDLSLLGQWLDLIGEIAVEARERPPYYSGYASLELEAAPSSEAVANAIKVLDGEFDLY